MAVGCRSEGENFVQTFMNLLPQILALAVRLSTGPDWAAKSERKRDGAHVRSQQGFLGGDDEY